jgi:hypothetical protein
LSYVTNEASVVSALGAGAEVDVVGVVGLGVLGPHLGALGVIVEGHVEPLEVVRVEEAVGVGGAPSGYSATVWTIESIIMRQNGDSKNLSST